MRRGATSFIPVLLTALSACAVGPTHLEERVISDAKRGLGDDPAVQAQALRVEAARAQERTETYIDEIQIRIADHDDGQNDVRMLARVPIPNPWEIRARQDAYRAETLGEVARLSEVALRRYVEKCSFDVERAFARESAELFEQYSAEQRRLLERMHELGRSGAVAEETAIGFKIDRGIVLVRRSPKIVLDEESGEGSLPPLPELQNPLDTRLPVIREAILERHPSVAVSAANSDRFEALSEAAEAGRRPWLEFADVGYEFREGRHDDFGGQLAVRLPIGSRASAEVARYRAERESAQRRGDERVESQLHEARAALAEVARYEAAAEELRGLLDLAQRANSIADRLVRERLAPPQDVAQLRDQAYEARMAVLEARARAGRADCQLLSNTGVSSREWARSN